MKKVLTLIVFASLLVSCFSDSDDEIITQCAVPTNIQFDTSTDESIVITWDNSNVSATYIIEYGVSGFILGEGIEVTSNEATITITGLDAETTYDVYVQSICPNNESMPTSVYSFTTLQCSTPTNIQFTNVDIESVDITWDDNNSSATFSIEYGITGFTPGTGTIETTNDANLSLLSLDSETTYDVYVTAICATSDSMPSTVTSFTTLAALVVPQFLTNLSDLNLYSGDMEDIAPSIYAFEYILATPLFTDYAHKQRLIALPAGTSMDYVNDGFPNFPDNTVISKTFYYNNDERDESLGKKIIETRVLIKQSGSWVLGNYKWNDAQTDAVLDDATHIVPVSYIDDIGDTQNVDYEIPSAADCVTCHDNSGNARPIGPKLRALNINNQLQELIDQNLLSNLANPDVVTVLPNWEDTGSFTLEERTRAYFDVNCAHCHSPGGNCYPESNLDLRFETRFDDTNIFEHRFSIQTRTQSLIPNYSMPLIGTTILHPEGYEMIEDYINTL